MDDLTVLDARYIGDLELNGLVSGGHPGERPRIRIRGPSPRYYPVSGVEDLISVERHVRHCGVQGTDGPLRVLEAVGPGVALTHTSRYLSTSTTSGGVERSPEVTNSM